MFKRLAAVLAALFIPALALAGTDTPGGVTAGGKGLIYETGEAGGTGESFVGVVIFWEADDTAAYGGPTGATLDTGTEACAVYGMSCFDTEIFATGGGAGDEFTATDCTTDQTDNVLLMSFCY